MYQTDVSRLTASGNGTAVEFPLAMPIYDVTHLQVWEYVAATGVLTLLTRGTNYTLSLYADYSGGMVQFVHGPGGGSVVYAPATGTTFVFLRVVPFTQDTNLRNWGKNDQEALERQIDLAFMAVSQLAEVVDRCAKLDVTYGPGSGASFLESITAQVTLAIAARVATESAAATATAQAVIATAKALAASNASGTSLTYSLAAAASALSASNSASAALATVEFNVKAYGAIGNGTTDDGTAIASSVSAAISAGGFVYLPAGSYLTTASVANFASVRFRGPGAIKRGSALFYPEPSAAQTNNLYVSTTGSDSNDGLSASQPLLTPQKAFNIMVNYGPTLPGHWVVNLAAGTYTSGVRQRGLHSINEILILGPNVGGSPNVPTAIFDGYGTGTTIGLFFEYGMRIGLENIKAKRWTGAGTSGGFYAAYGCDLRLKNCHTDACGYYGASVWNGGSLIVDGGIYNGSTNYGIIAYSCQYVIGSNGAVGSNRVSVQNCSTNILVIGYANGHVKYSDLGGTGVLTNIWLNAGARAHIDGCACSGASGCDLLVDGPSVWYSGGVENTFGSTIPYKHYSGGSCEDDKLLQSLDKKNSRIAWGYTHTPNTDGGKDLGTSALRWGRMMSNLHMVLATQQDKTNSGSGSTILTSPSLPAGTYRVEIEGDVTSGASGGLWVNVQGTATLTYARGRGQSWNGTTLVVSRGDSATSGTPNLTFVAVAAALTNIRIVYTIVISVAGTVTLRWAQEVSDGTTCSIYAGLMMKITPLA